MKPKKTTRPAQIKRAPPTVGEIMSRMNYWMAEPWWPQESDGYELVSRCALGFDGGKFDKELTRDMPDASSYMGLVRMLEAEFGDTLKLSPEELNNWGAFFYLQRALKWGDTLPRPSALLFMRLFLHLHGTEVPRGYQREGSEGDCCPREQARAATLADTLRPHLEVALKNQTCNLEQNPL